MSDHTRTARERAEELLPTAEDIQEQFISGAMLTGFAYSRAEALRDWEAWREREQSARDAEPTTVTAEQIEACARAAYVADSLDYETGEWDRSDVYEKGAYRNIAEAVFRAAGFRIEGDPA